MTINKNRGRVVEAVSTKALITIHPSYLLRIQDPAEARSEYARFIADLTLAVPFL
jgi:DNA polymerase